MSFKNWIPISMVVLITMLLVACHKYPNDAFISWQQPEKRILGVWHLTNFIVDGVDSTENYLKTYPIVCDFWFHGKRWEGTGDYFASNKNCSTKDFTFYMPYTFKRHTIKIGWYLPIGRNYTAIIKLWKNDFWLKGKANNKDYMLKFNRIE